MTEKRMFYGRYKKHFSDCETVSGSYDKETKTIIVLIPEGRMKKSGVRGQSYRYITFDGIENNTGRKVSITIKSICIENAIKRLPDNCTWDLSPWGK